MELNMSKPTITDVINNLEDEIIGYQILNNTVTASKARKNGNSVTFDTDPQHMTPDDLVTGKGVVGLILWIDRDNLSTSYEKTKEKT
jgi:hypothetical protein